MVNLVKLLWQGTKVGKCSQIRLLQISHIAKKSEIRQWPICQLVISKI